MLVDVPPEDRSATDSGRALKRRKGPVHRNRGRRRPRSRRQVVLSLVLGLEIVVAAACVVALAVPSLTQPLRSDPTVKKHTPPLKHTPPPPTAANSRPGIAIMTPITGKSSFDLAGTFMATFGNMDYSYLGTALGRPYSNVTVVSGSPGQWDFADAHDALPTLPAWAFPNTGTLVGGVAWDPEVFKFGSTYVMYMAPGLKNYLHPVTHCIGVARSNSPSGPFTPAASPLVCQAAMGGSLDGQIFVDPSGPNGPQNPYYLIWKSDNNNLPVGSANRTTSIWVHGVSNDGMSLIGGGPWKIFSPDEPWQHGFVEAPQLQRGPDGSIYLFYSGGACYCSKGYAIGVAHCASILGPCHDLSAIPLISSNAQGDGPGEPSVYQAPDGSVWLIYNPWTGPDPGRPLFRPLEAARIRFGRAGPYVAQAGAFPSP